MWYNQVVKDISVLPDFLDHYEHELAQAKFEVKISGSLEKALSQLPGITEQRFSQLQELEAILNYMNIQLRKIKQTHYKKYLEGYNRQLTSRDAERYADSEDEVIDYETLINHVALMRNKWLGILKGIDQKSKNNPYGYISS